MTSSPHEAFRQEVRENIERLEQAEPLHQMSYDWVDSTAPYRYAYNFTWMGRPIIQFPQDIVAVQEIIWETRPDLIIETGIAHGGSLILSASCLQLLGGDGIVVGVDIDIRKHNREAIEAHPLFDRIRLIEGSSIDPSVVQQVKQFASGRERIMVMLDSNHTEEHVLGELAAYSNLVTEGCYLIVFDTIIEQMNPDAFPDRPWGVGNNPCTAVRKFLAKNDQFELDRKIASKLLLSVAPHGYMRRVRRRETANER